MAQMWNCDSRQGLALLQSHIREFKGRKLKRYMEILFELKGMDSSFLTLQLQWTRQPLNLFFWKKGLIISE
jgi:hypothetical protein